MEFYGYIFILKQTNLASCPRRQKPGDSHPEEERQGMVRDELVGALVVWHVRVNGEKKSVTDTQDEGVSMLKL